jgi:hypothetical protein
MPADHLFGELAAGFAMSALLLHQQAKSPAMILAGRAAVDAATTAYLQHMVSVKHICVVTYGIDTVLRLLI